MSAIEQNEKRARIFGWSSCAIGVLYGIALLFEAAAIRGVGINPASVPYIARAVSVGFIALVVGIPLGVCACYLGRKLLGAVGTALCILTFVGQHIVQSIR